MTQRSISRTARGWRRPLDSLARQWAASLTTFKRDGTPVRTPINVVVESDHAYFRTFEQSWKFKRLLRDRRVEIAPSTLGGNVAGPAIRACARLLDGREAAHASRLIDQKYPIFQGILVRLYQHLMGLTARHFELRAAGE